MSQHAPSMLRSTLIGGAVFGVAGGLPLVGALNCFCCALVAGGGFFAAYLYSRECRQGGVAFGPAAGAGVGLVAGLFYTLATSLVSAVINRIVAVVFGQGDAREQFEQLVEQLEGSGVDTADFEQVLEWFSSASPILLAVLGVSMWLLISAVFSTLGGVIGGSVFKLDPQPPAQASPDGGVSPPTV